jgi:hypothetical protein
MPLVRNGTSVSPSTFRLISVLLPLQISVMQPKNRISLQFNDAHSLWLFAQQLSSKSLEIMPANRILQCECSESEINLALSKYGARILEGNVTKVLS